jgi:hypothetical protein
MDSGQSGSVLNLGIHSVGSEKGMIYLDYLKLNEK